MPAWCRVYSPLDDRWWKEPDRHLYLKWYEEDTNKKEEKREMNIKIWRERPEETKAAFFKTKQTNEQTDTHTHLVYHEKETKENFF